MNLKAQERNITEFKKINDISSLVEFFKSNYCIETIFCFPQSKLTPLRLKNIITQNALIPVKFWKFEKDEYPPFLGYVNIFFEKFMYLYEKYERKIGSAETLDDLKHELSDAKEELITLRSKHASQTIFSVLGNIETSILVDKGFVPISLLLTDYVSKPDTVLYAFKIRAEFFQELIVRISILLDKINNIVNEKPGITPKKPTAQYLIYELVYALQHSDYFDIPDTEKEKLENSLFTLFNIKKRDKRSKVLGNINNNKSGLKCKIRLN